MEKNGTKLQYSSNNQPKINRQTEAVNRSLGNILLTRITTFGRCDATLPKVEFEFNCSINRSTGYSPLRFRWAQIHKDTADTSPQ